MFLDALVLARNENISIFSIYLMPVSLVIGTVSCQFNNLTVLSLLFQVKDQTYFLSHLSQFQLKKLLFPLGCMQKVRQESNRFSYNKLFPSILFSFFCLVTVVSYYIITFDWL